MASRAIIARSIKNGFFTAWCWLNGDPKSIGGLLRTGFTSEDVVEELISFKSILGIFKDPADDPNKNIEGSFARLKNGLYVKYDDGKGTVVSGGREGFFPSLAKLMQENVQYIYIFDNGSWLTYKMDQNFADQKAPFKPQQNSAAQKAPVKPQQKPALSKSAPEVPVSLGERIKTRLKQHRDRLRKNLKNS